MFFHSIKCLGVNNKDVRQSINFGCLCSFKNNKMEVFGKHIFGTDAEQWLKLCKESKREWILKNTNQTDNNLIDEFINNPKISKECKCLDCGKNGNKRETIPTEVATDTEQVNDGAVGKRNSTKRPREVKRTKN